MLVGWVFLNLAILWRRLIFLFYFYPKTKGEDAIYATCIFWHHCRSYAFPEVQVDIFLYFIFTRNVLKGWRQRVGPCLDFLFFIPQCALCNPAGFFTLPIFPGLLLHIADFSWAVSQCGNTGVGPVDWCFLFFTGWHALCNHHELYNPAS